VKAGELMQHQAEYILAFLSLGQKRHQKISFLWLMQSSEVNSEKPVRTALRGLGPGYQAGRGGEILSFKRSTAVISLVE